MVAIICRFPFIVFLEASQDWREKPLNYVFLIRLHPFPRSDRRRFIMEIGKKTMPSRRERRPFLLFFPRRQSVISSLLSKPTRRRVTRLMRDSAANDAAIARRINLNLNEQRRNRGHVLISDSAGHRISTDNAFGVGGNKGFRACIKE